MERELKDATSRCKSLEEDNKAKATKLDKALLEAKEAGSESRAAQEEIRQAGEIAAGLCCLCFREKASLKGAIPGYL